MNEAALPDSIARLRLKVYCPRRITHMPANKALSPTQRPTISAVGLEAEPEHGDPDQETEKLPAKLSCNPVNTTEECVALNATVPSAPDKQNWCVSEAGVTP